MVLRTSRAAESGLTGSNHFIAAGVASQRLTKLYLHWMNDKPFTCNTFEAVSVWTRYDIVRNVMFRNGKFYRIYVLGQGRWSASRFFFLGCLPKKLTSHAGQDVSLCGTHSWPKMTVDGLTRHL